MTNVAGRPRPGHAVCADIGSTFTKVAVVDLANGALLATAQHRTTADTDLLEGLDAAASAAGADPDAPVLACSSAGGGLRLAVVGHEQLVSAEAGHRAALSAGARVVHVSAGALTASDVGELCACDPDVVLLVGGTDGGESATIRHNAARLAAAGMAAPVVVAGNHEVRAEVAATLAAGGLPVRSVDNVLPRIGQLRPAPARAAIRDAFLRHVIGGSRLPAGPRLGRMLRGATPDAVLAAVELLADQGAGDLLVVDVGGATTDVYSTVTPEPDSPAPPEVVGSLWRARTVEGDLGTRWSAPGLVAAAQAERLLDADEVGPLAESALLRTADPAMLPADAATHASDRQLARLAATVALRRHARGDRPGASTRRDLQRVRLVVGSGGVLRHAGAPAAVTVLQAAVDDPAGGWPLPRQPRFVVDDNYVLAAAGLLAAAHPQAATALLHRHLTGPPTG